MKKPESILQPIIKVLVTSEKITFFSKTSHTRGLELISRLKGPVTKFVEATFKYKDFLLMSSFNSTFRLLAIYYNDQIEGIMSCVYNCYDYPHFQLSFLSTDLNFNSYSDACKVIPNFSNTYFGWLLKLVLITNRIDIFLKDSFSVTLPDFKNYVLDNLNKRIGAKNAKGDEPRFKPARINKFKLLLEAIKDANAVTYNKEFPVLTYNTTEEHNNFMAKHSLKKNKEGKEELEEEKKEEIAEEKKGKKEKKKKIKKTK